MTIGAQFKPTNTVPLQISVNTIVARNLDKMAKQAGAPVSVFVQQLFDAAYSSRCQPTGDAALDAAVRRMDAPAQERHKTAGPAQNGRSSANGQADEGKAALQAMLKTLQENFRVKEQELRDARSALAEAQKSARADQSREILDLRRKVFDAEAKLAHVERDALVKIEAAKKELQATKAEAAEEIRSLKGRIGGLTAKANRVEAAPSQADEIADLRAKLLEMGKAIALAEAKSDRDHAEIAALTVERDGLKERISELQAARLDLARQLEPARRAEASRPAGQPSMTIGGAVPPRRWTPEGEFVVTYAALQAHQDEIDAIKARLDELSGAILHREPEPAPAPVHPQDEADALDVVTTRQIRGYYSAGRSPADIAKIIPNVSLQAIKIICRIAPSKTQQALAAAKMQAGAR